MARLKKKVKIPATIAPIAPSFNLDFELDLLKTYTGVTLPKDLGKNAQESVKAEDAETDSQQVARTIRRFFLKH